MTANPSPTPTPPTTPEAAPTPTPETPTPEATPAAAPLELASIKLPEGFTLDEKQGGDFVALMNDEKLSRAELAQKLIDTYANLVKTSSEQGTQAFMDLQASWRQEIEKDAEIGGAKLPETTAAIGRVMEKYGSSEAREAFNTTGAGNNPHIVRMLAKMAADLNEPGPIPPPSPAANSVPLEQKFYPTMGNKQ